MLVDQRRVSDFSVGLSWSFGIRISSFPKFVSIRVHSWLESQITCHATHLARRLYCNADCNSVGRLHGTVTDTQSNCFPHSAATGCIDCDRKDWLQQPASHARSRVG